MLRRNTRRAERFIVLTAPRELQLPQHLTRATDVPRGPAYRVRTGLA